MGLDLSDINRSVFIAGTDTGIGKTHAACTLLHALRAAGHAACGMKPVASGCVETAEGLRNDDALALQSAGRTLLPYALINPVALRDPLSPHLAAAHDGVEISLAPMRQAFGQLAGSQQRGVVEGGGGKGAGAVRRRPEGHRGGDEQPGVDGDR